MNLLLTRLIISRTVLCDKILKNITMQEIGGDLAQGDCARKGHHKAGAEAAQGRPRHSGTQPSPLFQLLTEFLFSPSFIIMPCFVFVTKGYVP
jgi:hypothetical protein